MEGLTGRKEHRLILERGSPSDSCGNNSGWMNEMGQVESSRRGNRVDQSHPQTHSNFVCPQAKRSEEPSKKKEKGM